MAPPQPGPVDVSPPPYRIPRPCTVWPSTFALQLTLFCCYQGVHRLVRTLVVPPIGVSAATPRAHTPSQPTPEPRALAPLRLGPPSAFPATPTRTATQLVPLAQTVTTTLSHVDGALRTPAARTRRSRTLSPSSASSLVPLLPNLAGPTNSSLAHVLCSWQRTSCSCASGCSPVTRPASPVRQPGSLELVSGS